MEGKTTYVILGFLDAIAPYYSVVAMAVVLLPGNKVDLLEQLLLMMFELADHECCRSTKIGVK